MVSWPQLEARGATASWHGAQLVIEGPDALHEPIREAIYARVPRLRLSATIARVERGTCDGCELPIGRPKLGWCPLCIAAWVVVLRERAQPARVAA